MKRKQFVKNFAIEKERQRKHATSKGLIKVSSASALPPQFPAHHATVKGARGDLLHNNGQRVEAGNRTQRAWEVTSENRPAKVADGLSAH